MVIAEKISGRYSELTTIGIAKNEEEVKLQSLQGTGEAAEAVGNQHEC